MHKVYFVGAGPGAPDLITVRGLEILRQADVVIYDYLVDKIILEEVKLGAQFFCCNKLGGNRYSDGFLKRQERINKLIVKKAKEGKKVIRLKSGDSSIFSRLSQELDILTKNKIEFEVVPAVTAASAASSFSGIPLTDRRFASSCIFVTGHEDPGKKESSIDWDKIAGCPTIVLYMAVESLEAIVNKLIKAGKDEFTPIAIIQDASLVTQKVLTGTLRNIVNKAKDKKVRPPAIVIIGETVRLEKRFNWFKKNRRILFTGLSKKRFFIKGTYFHLPLIKIEPISDYTEFDNYLKNIRRFDWIVFTSRYSAEYFFNRLKQIGCDSRILRDINIAAIGNSTANKILCFGIKTDLAPNDESSKGLLDVFKKIDIKNKKIFLPRSDIADKGLAQGLKDLGAKVTASVAYKNVVPGDLPELDLRYFDEIMFTSPSGVRNFLKRYGKVPRGIKISCIGEVTEIEAKKWDLLN
jgi:uroporphyrinogen III methyltransferase / synthase